MKVDFNGLRESIADSFNYLLGKMDEELSHAYQEAFLEEINELRSDLLLLMCIYMDENDKDFCNTVTLNKLRVERENEN